MKKIFTLLLFIFSSLILSQEKKDYVRSSLHMHLVDDFSFENGDKVLMSYNKFEFPQNYNDHRIDLNKIKLSEFELTDEEKEAAGKKKSLIGGALADAAKGAVAESTAGLVKVQDNSMVKLQLDKYIKEKKMGHELIKKWFKIPDDGSGSGLGMVLKRAAMSKSNEMAAIGDASGTGDTEAQYVNIVDNTFVVFTRLNYVSNAIAAEVIRQAAYQQAAKVPAMLQKKAYQVADKIYEKTSEGYSVWTTAWLYKLIWTPEMYAQLGKLRNDEGMIDMDKFYAMDINLEFLSQEKATSLVTFSLKKEDKGRTEQDVFDLSTVRNMDKVLVKLQKKNEVFKPIFPLRDGFAVAAGKKEGIEGGETFEVLETKKGKYNRIGTMKVDGKRVWDNSWTGEDIKPGLTYFKKGSKKFVPGIHYVRLVK